MGEIRMGIVPPDILKNAPGPKAVRSVLLGSVYLQDGTVATIEQALAGTSDKLRMTPFSTHAVIQKILGSAGTKPIEYFATAEQGRLAEGAVQKTEIGTAAKLNIADFATATQGELAETAVQPGHLGTAAKKPIEAFATAGQGQKAETALQAESLVPINASVQQLKTDVVTLSGAVQGATAGNRTAELWTALSAKIGDREFQPGFVPDTDTGTHVDPLTGATVPNAGEYRWALTGWRWVAANANAVKRLATGTVLPTLSNQRVVVISADGTSSGLISFTDLFNQILGGIMPTQYPFEGTKVIGKTPSIVINYDPSIKRAFFYNPSKTAVITVASKGRTPVQNSVGRVLLPGGSTEFTHSSLAEYTAVSTEDATPLEFEFSNTSNVDPNIEIAANAHLRRYSTALSDGQQAIIRKLYKKFDTAGIFAKGGRIGVLSAPSTNDALLRWGADNSGLYTLLSLPTADWSGMNFDGVDDGIDVGAKLTDIATAVNHTLLVWADETPNPGSGSFAIGDSAARVGPNRSATQASIAGMSAAQTVTVGARGGLIGYTKTETGKFSVHRNDDLVTDVTATDIAAATVSLYVGALHVSSGLASPYLGKLKFFYAGPALSKLERDTVYAAVREYLTSVAGL